ncbi:MAG TPA: molybdopterin-dependent oxidoreductase [Segetibacter sp.]|jgi:DMSO/TMAO reductase YedYZ molybdopterin-dependent catalytic subunit
MSKRLLPEETLSERAVQKRSLIAFAIFLAFMLAGFTAFKWINRQPKVAGTVAPLRKTLNANERIFSAVFDSNLLVKEYPVSQAAKRVRVNGLDGLRDTVSEATWRLQVVKAAGDTLRLTLDDIKKLPKKDLVFDFKCIEGWDQVTHWGGVPLKTFMQHYGLNAQSKMAYIGMQTPDKKYYVGIDMPSAIHPQTLLCYEMNGQPLPIDQGFPLRLIIPVKYGIKHLKRIGTMFFSNEKPPDFWAERGYDYYAGH